MSYFARFQDFGITEKYFLNLSAMRRARRADPPRRIHACHGRAPGGWRALINPLCVVLSDDVANWALAAMALKAPWRRHRCQRAAQMGWDGSVVDGYGRQLSLEGLKYHQKNNLSEVIHPCNDSLTLF